MNKHTKYDLAQMQSLPLEVKVRMTEQRIREWYDHWDGQVYVSFSGGKDSTVLLHIVRSIYPDVEAVFVNTGLEYPEIQKFVMSFDNVTVLRPKMRFDEVIKTYGYPVISKEVSRKVGYYRKGAKWAQKFVEGTSLDAHGNKSRYCITKWKPLASTDFLVTDACCSVMKKSPTKEYAKRTGKKPITAIIAEESLLREQSWIKHGCNAFDNKRPISNPMAFWTEQDILHYIKQHNLPIASVYGDVVYKDNPDQMRLDDFGFDCGEKLTTTGCDRTGCIFCGFGCHLEKEPSRFQRLKETHPKQYAYCIGGGAYDEDGLWKPSKEGLGLGHIFDELNKIYGDGFIKY